jgi:bifunctional DNA-binding transcriptional regulator/antitoxin component of YhaV-PrlF toxin-antitoxin module
VAIKIKSYRLSQRGARGCALTLPAVWLNDLGLKPGVRLDVYRDDQDRIIICPPGVLPGVDLSSGEAREIKEALKCKTRK